MEKLKEHIITDADIAHLREALTHLQTLVDEALGKAAKKKRTKAIEESVDTLQLLLRSLGLSIGPHEQSVSEDLLATADAFKQKVRVLCNPFVAREETANLLLQAGTLIDRVSALR